MNPKKEIGFLVRFICESDAIEGICDDPALVRAQLIKPRASGHVGALLHLDACAARRIPLTDTLIKRTQFLIVTEQPAKGAREIAQKYRGNWRDCDVWIVKRVGTLIVEEIKTVSPVEVPSLMLALIGEIARWQATCAGLSDSEKIAAIARFHYDYLKIHPFADGNGRSGRALAYYLYRFAGLKPFIFTAGDRYETYYRCFRDPMDMFEYFRERTQPRTK